MQWEAIFILAILIEAVVTNIKVIWTDNEFQISSFVTLIISIIIALLTGADIFPLVGLEISIPFFGAALTGIIISRGANFVYDLWQKIIGNKVENDKGLTGDENG